jgi:xanthine dehydrogenase molybdenum-binding subunit
MPWSDFMGMNTTITGKGRFDQDFTIPNFMMVFAEVEVDTETGKVDVIKFVAASDPGITIDPIAVRMQLQGGLGAAGLDTAVFEETVLDRTGAIGRILNCNMIDYKWRPFNELPSYDQALPQTPLPSHLFGAIGVGEIACAPGPCAVLMAISNALGVRAHDYPMTPDKVLKVLGKI